MREAAHAPDRGIAPSTRREFQQVAGAAAPACRRPTPPNRSRAPSATVGDCRQRAAAPRRRRLRRGPANVRVAPPSTRYQHGRASATSCSVQRAARTGEQMQRQQQRDVRARRRATIAGDNGRPASRTACRSASSRNESHNQQQATEELIDSLLRGNPQICARRATATSARPSAGARRCRRRCATCRRSPASARSSRSRRCRCATAACSI